MNIIELISRALKSFLGCKEALYIDKYNEAKAEIETWKATVDALQDEIAENTWDEGTKPTWLNIDVAPYTPLIEIEGETIKLDPHDIYMECRTLRNIATQWRDLPLDERLKEIEKLVITRITYKYDKSENWLPPIVTYERRFGDCEDGTILFLTLARLAHVPADRIFNACGWYKTSDGQYGHSYVIAKMQNDEWYIFETTLDSIPSKHKLFKDSNYDATWGYANWKFAGKGPEQV